MVSVDIDFSVNLQAPYPHTKKNQYLFKLLACDLVKMLQQSIMFYTKQCFCLYEFKEIDRKRVLYKRRVKIISNNVSTVERALSYDDLVTM